MEWCNCDHGLNGYYSDVLKNVDGSSAYLTCVHCGKRISDEDMIAILFLEIRTLKKIVVDLEIDMVERDLLIAEKESAQLAEYKKIDEDLNKQTKRFEIMDL